MPAAIALFVLSLACAVVAQRQFALEQPQDIYPGCHCVYEWNDDNRVGDWATPDQWLQLEEPPAVAFVNISGDNTITLRHDRQINHLLLGENRWDTTRLVLQEDLIISTCL